MQIRSCFSQALTHRRLWGLTVVQTWIYVNHNNDNWTIRAVVRHSFRSKSADNVLTHLPQVFLLLYLALPSHKINKTNYIPSGLDTATIALTTEVGHYYLVHILIVVKLASVRTDLRVAVQLWQY